MKNLLKSFSFFAMVLMACVNFSSCSSGGDDTETDAVKYEIIGEWGIQKLDFLEPTTPIEDVAYGCCIPFIKLTSDGNVEYHEWNYVLSEPKQEKHKGTYILKGDQLTISCNNQYLAGTYTIEKATKTLLILVKKTAQYTIQEEWGKSYYKM